MNKEIFLNSTKDDIIAVLNYVLETLNKKDTELFNCLEMDIFKYLNIKHFTKELSEQAVSGLVNEDGTTGEHWSLSQTTELLRKYALGDNTFNEYDWYYVLNMIYSDYYGAFPDELETYVKLANKFLNDKDAEEGKAFKYWLSNR